MITSYEIKDNYIELNISSKKGKNFISYIDIEDLSRVINYKYCWNATYRSNIRGYYIAANEYLGMFEGKPKYKTVLLHDFILNKQEGFTDHFNHNTLDNRKQNLRNTTNDKNTKNRKTKNKNNTTGYRNVTFYQGWYLVQLQVDGKNQLLGKFQNLNDAGLFAEQMRKKYYKNFSGNN